MTRSVPCSNHTPAESPPEGPNTRRTALSSDQEIRLGCQLALSGGNAQLASGSRKGPLAPILDARSIAYPPGSAWNHNFILLTAWPKRPWTHSSYLSGSKVRGQIMHCRCARPAGDGEQRGPGREPAAEGPDVLEREAKPQGQGGRPGRELQVASIGRRHRLARPRAGRARCRRSNGTSHEPHQKTLSSSSPVPAKASRSVLGR